MNLFHTNMFILNLTTLFFFLSDTLFMFFDNPINFWPCTRLTWSSVQSLPIYQRLNLVLVK